MNGVRKTLRSDYDTGAIDSRGVRTDFIGRTFNDCTRDAAWARTPKRRREFAPAPSTTKRQR
jgi:hypothetical protein